MALVDGDINLSSQQFIDEQPVEGLDSAASTQDEIAKELQDLAEKQRDLLITKKAPTQDEIAKKARDLAEKQRHLSSQSDLSESQNSINKKESKSDNLVHLKKVVVKNNTFEVLHFPTDLTQFPNVFVKMEFYDRKKKYNVSKGEPIDPPDTIIYLPFPDSEGFLQRQFQMSWNYNELGLPGEFAKRNTDHALDFFSNAGKLEYSKAGDDFLKIFSKGGFVGAMNTFLEKTVLDTRQGSAARKAITQATGYEFAPHKTLMFDGMIQQETVLIDYTFTAKSINDARMLENISKTIMKASLPELKEEQFRNVIVKNYLPDWLTFDAIGPTIDNTQPDVWVSDEKTDPDGTGNRQYFSSTFDLPKRLHLKIMKKSSYKDKKEDAREAEELYSFPMGFVITDVNLEQSSGNNAGQHEELSMIKYVDPTTGEVEYFNQKFVILFSVQEESVYTSERMIDYTEKLKR